LYKWGYCEILYYYLKKMSNLKPGTTLFPTERIEKFLYVLAVAVLLLSCLAGCASRYTIKAPEYARYNGEINQHKRLIRAQKSRVFQVLTNEKTIQEICPEGTVVAHEPQLPYGVGTLINTKANHIFKLEWNTRVEEVIPHKMIRLRFLDGFFSGGTEIWEIEEQGEYILVSHTIIVRPRSFLQKMAWILKVRRKHDKMVEDFLENLQTVLEVG
ncbi:MAG: SRPBCC family protein, partial [Proteobacteria bacterium]|nr:SRPBCC family protein [Pseudomonadota bacterium]